MRRRNLIRELRELPRILILTVVAVGFGGCVWPGIDDRNLHRRSIEEMYGTNEVDFREQVGIVPISVTDRPHPSPEGVPFSPRLRPQPQEREPIRTREAVQQMEVVFPIVHGTNFHPKPTTNYMVWSSNGSNVASFHIWHSTDLQVWSWCAVVTTNRFQMTPSPLPKEFFKVRAVSAAGQVSEWGTR